MKIFATALLLLLLTLPFKAQDFKTQLTAKEILDDKVNLKRIEYKDKDIVFLSMHHIGTKEFYREVKNKVDSLSKVGYYFYIEMVSADASKKDDLMKLRKIVGFGIPQDGYQKALEIITGRIKYLKDKLILQPPYTAWNLNEANSKVVDAKLSDMLKEYETEHGEIVLEKCDLKVPDISQNTRCRYDKKLGKAYKKVIVEYRNQLIANELMRDIRKKIVLVYGEGHYSGIKEILEKSNSANITH